MKVALLFSPQGSQELGMGRDLAAAYPAAASIFAAADAILGWPVSDLSWHGPVERLDDTRQTQPCVMTTSLACLAALESAMATPGGPGPVLVAGHSVGEYAALVAAGVLAFEDGLRLVALRGALMADAGMSGGMAAIIGLDRRAVVETLAAAGLGDAVTLANDNSPGQVVISGTLAGLTAIAGPLNAAGARRAIPLRVSGPFHSPSMASVGVRMAEAFEAVAWLDADPPLVSNVSAEPVRDALQIRRLLARQVSSPVEWVRSVQRMAAAGIDTFVECGPGGALSGMVRRIVPGARTLRVSDMPTLAATVEALTGSLVGAGA